MNTASAIVNARHAAYIPHRDIPETIGIANTPPALENLRKPGPTHDVKQIGSALNTQQHERGTLGTAEMSNTPMSTNITKRTDPDRERSNVVDTETPRSENSGLYLHTGKSWYVRDRRNLEKPAPDDNPETTNQALGRAMGHIEHIDYKMGTPKTQATSRCFWVARNMKTRVE